MNIFWYNYNAIFIDDKIISNFLVLSNTQSMFIFLNYLRTLGFFESRSKQDLHIPFACCISQVSFISSFSTAFSFIFSSCHLLVTETRSIVLRSISHSRLVSLLSVVLTCSPILRVSCKMEVSSKGSVKFRGWLKKILNKYLPNELDT